MSVYRPRDYHRSVQPPFFKSSIKFFFGGRRSSFQRLQSRTLRRQNNSLLPRAPQQAGAPAARFDKPHYEQEAFCNRLMKDGNLLLGS